MTWQDGVVSHVVEEILFANRGIWPQTKDDWERVASRFGFHVCFNPGLRPRLACIIREVIHVPEPSEGLPIQSAVFRHELAEAALLWEGRAPCQVPAVSMQDARHAVATMVERHKSG